MKSIFHLLSFLIVICFACTPPSTKNNEIKIALKWSLEKNVELNNQDVHEVTFSLHNLSTNLLADNWKIYWNQSPRKIISIDSSLNLGIQQINGDYYKLFPLKGFSLASKKSIDFKIIAAAWMIKESDGPVGVYTVLNPGENQVIERLENFEISPFKNPNQINRSKNDFEAIPTAEVLFNKNKSLSILPKETTYKTIPSPLSLKPQSGFFSFDKRLSILYPKNLSSEIDLFSQSLSAQFNIQLIPSEDKSPDIIIEFDNTLKNKEAYTLEIDKGKITIRGKENSGIFYGIQSLLQLIEKEETGFSIPACSIKDSPAFSYRGIHLDMARNFQSKATLLKMIDLLAKYKVNKIVLCLTEDEAWRIEIDGLPELTEVGSKRGHPTAEGTHLQPSYGSGPFVDNPNGSGFYTQADFKKILKYAHDRHIDVIPLINFPGHARAAIKAMEYRYQRLMKLGKEEQASQYRLIDPSDQSTYYSAQHYNDNIVCVCQESTYNFYEFVVNDIIKMYKDASVPLYMFHTGGDEVPRGAWLDSPICSEYLKNHSDLKTTPEIQAHFFDRATKMLQTKVPKIGGWEEVVMSYDEQGKWFTNTSFTERNTYPYIWNNLWGQQDLGYKIANKGYPVILCNVTNLYFDLAYDKDPREPGLYWGGFNDTKDAFSFLPENLFLSTETDNMGKRFDVEKDFQEMEQLTEKGKENIIGIQAQLWTETVRGEQLFEYYIIPKLFGFAQRAWQGQPSWASEKEIQKRNNLADTDWNIFTNTISQKHLQPLDQLNGGYHYRIPAPGIKLQENKIFMNTAFPGMEIRYTTNGEVPSATSKLYENPFDYNGQTVIAKVFNSTGRFVFQRVSKKK